MSAFALVFPPEPEHPPEPPRKTKGELKRERRLAMQPQPPEGTVLMTFSESAKAKYRDRLFERNPRCIYCNQRVTPSTATAEHAIPRARGGLNSPANVWLSCKNCNNLKSDRTPLEWLQQLYDACVRMGFIDDDEAEFYAAGGWD